ncbi:MAG: hypothetical protein N2663_07225, partial [Chlorobi bacterium]|nr:hypothetical protein [Chlorobiota bacterium]
IPSLAIFGGGLLPVHVGGQRSSAYALGTRYVHLLSERVGIAIGAIGARSIGERSSDTTTITLAAPFICATLRFGNARLTAGYGYAFKEHLSTSQRFRADTPVFSLGGDYQFAEQWKLAADIFHLSTVESLPIAVAARYFGERFSLEGGIVVGVPTASSERFFAVPLLSAFWMFR